MLQDRTQTHFHQHGGLLVEKMAERLLAGVSKLSAHLTNLSKNVFHSRHVVGRMEHEFILELLV